MNHLAHLLLSCQDDHLLVGNFLADFLSKREMDQYPQNIQRGFELHRFIDNFTDNHPEVRKATALLHARHHKYAPVIVDIFFDYFLSLHWLDFHPEPLEAFTQKVYQKLSSHLRIMPNRLQRDLPYMIQDDWLCAYGNMSALEGTFRRIKKRVSRPEQLDGVIDSLKDNHAALEIHFQRFFPILQEACSDWCFSKEH